VAFAVRYYVTIAGGFVGVIAGIVLLANAELFGLFFLGVGGFTVVQRWRQMHAELAEIAAYAEVEGGDERDA
jgi:UPF0716 family protein affecting phage T7 exclusion